MLTWAFNMQGVLSAELLSHFQESLKNMERFYKRCCLGLGSAAGLLLDINHGIYLYSWHFSHLPLSLESKTSLLEEI